MSVCMIAHTTCISSVCFWFLGPIKMMYLASVLFPLDSNLYHKVIIHHSALVQTKQFTTFLKKKKFRILSCNGFLLPKEAVCSLEKGTFNSWWPAEKLLSINAEFCFSIHHDLNFILILAMLYGMWDLRSPVRDWTCAPCIGSTES